MNSKFHIALSVSFLLHLVLGTVIVSSQKPQASSSHEFVALNIRLGDAPIALKEVKLAPELAQQAEHYFRMHRPAQAASVPAPQPVEEQVAVEAVASEAPSVSVSETTGSQPPANASVSMASTPPAADAPKGETPAEAKPPVKLREVIEQASKEFVLPQAPVEGQRQQVRKTPSSGTEGAGNAVGNSTDKDATALLTYEQALPLWISRFKHYPDEAKAQGLRGTGIVFVKIDRQGRVLLAKIKESTGYALLDRALMQMVVDANPVVPLPDDYYPDKKTRAYEIKVTLPD